MAKIDTSGWKEFRVGDLFDSATGNFDIQPQHLSDDGVVVVSAGTANGGVIGRTKENVIVIPANTITIDMFGHAIFHDYTYTMVTHARVFALIPNEFISPSVGVYLVSILNCLLSEYVYSDMCSYRKIKDRLIKLPATPTGEPDWDYMDKYMSEVMKTTEASLRRETCCGCE